MPSLRPALHLAIQPVSSVALGIESSDHLRPGTQKRSKMKEIERKSLKSQRILKEFEAPSLSGHLEYLADATLRALHKVTCGKSAGKW